MGFKQNRRLNLSEFNMITGLANHSIEQAPNSPNVNGQVR